MVSRGLVREAREGLEAQQTKLKEVRDRLDRVSREDNQYLELATLEHRMLQVGPSGNSPPSPAQAPSMAGCGGVALTVDPVLEEVNLKILWWSKARASRACLPALP